MPQTVIYGPVSAGGLGFVPLVNIQAIQKIKHILQAYWHHTSLQPLFSIYFQWCQHVSGLSSSILHDTTIDIPSLQEEKWIQTLRYYLSQSGLKLTLPNHPVPQSKRYHDHVLMDYILQSSKYTKMEKVYLNRCCIYLKAVRTQWHNGSNFDLVTIHHLGHHLYI